MVTITTKSKSYSELITLLTFEDRLSYLQIHGRVGYDTFGFDRVFNQRFYCSKEWQSVRNEVIVRDGGCDLAMNDFEIDGSIFIHHMNPISMDDLKNLTEFLLDPEYLICTSLRTHNSIHFGIDLKIPKPQMITRVKNDTSPWLNRKD